MNTQDATTRLQQELAQEALAYLTLLQRQAAGEDVSAELHTSIFHLGTHATLLSERLEDEALAADARGDQRAS